MGRIYTYFIHYTGNEKTATINGSTQTVTKSKIKDTTQIRTIEKQIAIDRNLDSVVIDNFILLNKRFGKIGGKHENNSKR